MAEERAEPSGVKIEPKSALRKPEQLLETVSGSLSFRLDEPIDAAFPVAHIKHPYRTTLEALTPSMVIGLGLWIAGAAWILAYIAVMLAFVVLMIVYRTVAFESGVVAVTPTRYLLLRSKAGIPQAEVVSELSRSFQLPEPELVGRHRSGISGASLPFPGFKEGSKSWRYVGGRTDFDEALYVHLCRLANEAGPAGIVGSDPEVLIERMRMALGHDVGRVTAVYPLKTPIASSMILTRVVLIAGATTIVLMGALGVPMWVCLAGIGLLVIGTIMAVRLASPLKRHALVFADESALLVRHDDSLSQADVTGRGSIPADLDAFLKGHDLELDAGFSWVKTEAAAR